MSRDDIAVVVPSLFEDKQFLSRANDDGHHRDVRGMVVGRQRSDDGRQRTSQLVGSLCKLTDVYLLDLRQSGGLPRYSDGRKQLRQTAA
jgi:hypothetical protein